MTHTEREFLALRKSNTDAVVLEFEPQILAIEKAFSESGQSGGSAPYVIEAIISTIRKSLNGEAFSPLTGEDNEWVDISEATEGETFISQRDSRVFKEMGNCFMVSALVIKMENGTCYTGSFWKSESDMNTGDKSLKIPSKQPIPSFPFTPKSFYIDVVDINDELVCKDVSQLEDAMQYFK